MAINTKAMENGAVENGTAVAVTSRRDRPQPNNQLAWLAIFVLIAFTALGSFLGLGKILNLAFPGGCLVVGLLLYFRHPVLYVGFAWWLWFLTPFVRRIADYRSGFVDPSPILLAPYLVSLIALMTLFNYLPKIHRQGGLPFILVFTGVFYGLLIGLIKFPPATVIVALFDWLSPILLGFHLFTQWRDYPTYRRLFKRLFLWATLIMGTYGLVQYITAPDWDAFWLIKTNFTSAGKPEPLMMRIWSTLNSPGPFGNTMKSCLLLLLCVEGPLAVPASIAGYLTFLLASVRSAWGGWMVGVLAYSLSVKPKHQIRLFVTIAVLVVLVTPLVTIDPFADKILTRFETLGDLSNDGSATVRKDTFVLLVGPALSSFVGKGIGDKLYDWGIFAFLFNLGWIGTFFYVSGLGLLVFRLFHGVEPFALRDDSFFYCARAIVVSCIVQLPFGSVMAGVLGASLWSFLAMGLAAQTYYRANDYGAQYREREIRAPDPVGVL